MGITETGYQLKLISEWRQDIISEIRTTYPDLLLAPESIEGHIVDVVSNRLYQADLKMQALYNNTPKYAVGQALASFGLLKGLIPYTPQPASGNVTFVGDFGAEVDAGSLVKDSSELEYKTLADIILDEVCGNKIYIGFTSVPTGGTWTLNINGTSYVFNYDETDITLHPLVSGATGSYLEGFVCELTEAPSGVEVTRSSVFNASVSAFITEHEDLFKKSVNVLAPVPGNFTSSAWTVTSAVTSLPGVNYIYNEADMDSGTDAETDEEFYIRFNDNSGALGGTINGIRNLLPLLVNGDETEDLITKTVIKEHSGAGPAGAPNPLEIFVSGGISRGQSIADTLRLNLVSAGITLLGDELWTVTDDDGFEHPTRFSRVSSKLIYLRASIEVDSTFPGVDALKEAIIAYGNALSVGEDVIRIPGVTSAFAQVDGLTNIATLELSNDGFTWASSNIAVDTYEESEWVLANIDITVI